jgi:hypothetical protein
MPRPIGWTGDGAWMIPGGDAESRSIVSASAMEWVDRVLRCIEAEA